MIGWWINWIEYRPGVGGTSSLGGTRGATASLRATEIFTFPPPAPPPSPANSQGDDVAVWPGPFIQELARPVSAWVDGRALSSARNEGASFDYRELAAWSLVGALIGFAAFFVWFIYYAFVDLGLLNLFEP